MPIGSGAMFTKVWLGFQQFERLGLIAGAQPKLYGGQAEGCAPGRVGVRRGPARLAGAAELDRRRRSRSATRPTATSRSRRRRASGGGDLRGARGRDRREHLAARRDTAASSARARRASPSARCARRCARGELGESDRVVVLVTGTGLKTPQLSSEASGRIVEIDARRGRAARGAGSDARDRRGRERAARGDHDGRPRAASRPSTGGSSSCGDLHEHKEANGIPLRDPGREDAMVARLAAREPRAAVRRRASPSSSASCST